MQENALNNELEVGFDIPADVGMPESQIQTPALIVDLDALERNIRRMGRIASTMGVEHRLHAKMHKSVDIARLQQELGGACGICCQKVSEAEVFVRAGFDNVLISNQVRDPVKIDRLARLPLNGARILCLVDDPSNVVDLSAAAQRHGTQIECLVEMECGAGRCGVITTAEVVAIAKSIAAASQLQFAGIQAYHGPMQHIQSMAEREQTFAGLLIQVKEAIAALSSVGLPCQIVTGGGTGSYRLEAGSGVYNELQCGSYAFMDAHYGRTEGLEWEHALFILSGIISHVRPDQAICDAGLKVQSVDSGLPVIFGRGDVEYIQCSDEHGVIADPAGVLAINEKLRLIPGHCDPTCNMHDWYVGVRDGKVETLWPVSARGKCY